MCRKKPKYSLQQNCYKINFSTLVKLVSYHANYNANNLIKKVHNTKSFFLHNNNFVDTTTTSYFMSYIGIQDYTSRYHTSLKKWDKLICFHFDKWRLIECLHFYTFWTIYLICEYCHEMVYIFIIPCTTSRCISAHFVNKKVANAYNLYFSCTKSRLIVHLWIELYKRKWAA